MLSGLIGFVLRLLEVVEGLLNEVLEWCLWEVRVLGPSLHHIQKLIYFLLGIETFFNLQKPVINTLKLSPDLPIQIIELILLNKVAHILL